LKYKNLVLLIIAATAFVFAALLLNSATISLPNADLITKIELEQIRNGRDGGEIFTAESKDDIEAIMAALNGARRLWLQTGNAMNDSPLKQDYIAIRLYTIDNGEEVWFSRLFLYTEHDAEYLFNAYVGLYRINQNSSDKILNFIK